MKILNDKGADIHYSDPHVPYFPEVRSALSAINIPVSATLSELLAVTTADVVVLATPSGLHAQQAIQIAQSERHVVTEKPLATRWQDGHLFVMINYFQS